MMSLLRIYIFFWQRERETDIAIKKGRKTKLPREEGGKNKTRKEKVTQENRKKITQRSQKKMEMEITEKKR